MGAGGGGGMSAPCPGPGVRPCLASRRAITRSALDAACTAFAWTHGMIGEHGE